MSHEFNLKMIKFFTAALVMASVLLMVGGMALLRDSYYWKSGYYAVQFDYLKEAYLFASADRPSFKKILNEKIKGQPAAAEIDRPARSIPVLLYHGIINDASWDPDYVNITEKEFREHMYELKREGWRTITLDDYLAFSRGEKNLPEKSVMITFDDARKDSFYKADPLLRLFGYSAVMTVITGRSLGQANKEQNFHLNEIELGYMKKSGRWELASHGDRDHENELISPEGDKGHFLSNKLWLPGENRLETEEEYKRRVSEDMKNSRRELERKFAIKNKAFAFPFGDYGQQSVNFPESKDFIYSVSPTVFEILFYQAGRTEFFTNYKNDLPFVKRINTESPMTGRDLIEILSQNADKELPYAEKFEASHSWQDAWGTVAMVEGEALVLTGAGRDESALAILAGTYTWEDYEIEADVELTGQISFALESRVRNDTNFVACEYGPGYVNLSQKTDRLNNDMVVEVSTDYYSTKTARIGMKVTGNRAACLLNGKEIASREIDGALKNGGAAVKVWDAKKDEGVLKIKKFSATGI